MSRSTIAGNLLHSALELRQAETTTSASRLETYLETTPSEQFPGSNDIVGQSACQVADMGYGAHVNIPNDARR
jgi:hypothetical protein